MRDRLRQKFGDKLKIKDDPMNKRLYYDAKIDGKRYKTMARNTKQSKEEAMSKITKKQQQLIGELTIQENNKLSDHDILEDGITSYAYGHKNI